MYHFGEGEGKTYFNLRGGGGVKQFEPVTSPPSPPHNYFIEQLL